MTPDATLVDHLALVWGSIATLGQGLSENQWKIPTEVPGWTVQDNLVHVSALEWRLLGRPDPDHSIPDALPHVRNDVGRANEVFVDSRRPRSGAECLGEFVAVTDERLAQLRGLGPADFAADSWTPMGPGTVRDLLPFRVFDAWVHEQDMRRAVALPGDLDGPVADAAMARIVGTMPFIVGKKVGPPDGTTILFELGAPLAGRYAVAVEGRARLLDDEPAEPTTRIVTDGETFARMACGRVEPEAALRGGRVTVAGDEALGRRVVASLNFLF